MIGRGSTEVGELRGRVDMLTQLLTEQQTRARPQVWQPPPDPEESPETAARWAVQNEDGELYQRAMHVWREEDRASADLYELSVAHEYEMEQVRAEIEEL